MKRLQSAVPLLLVLLTYGASAFGEGKESSASAMVEAPTQSASAPIASVSAVAATPPQWKTGPREVALLDQATIKIPQDYAYLEQEDARQLLRKLGNPNVDDVAGLLTGPGGDWLMVVRFDKSGYIKDSEALDWKLDELLASLKDNTEQANAIRKMNGLSETEVVDWLEKPDYDVTKHRLIWGVSLREKGSKESDFQSVNFNAYSLGREGYINFNLVTDIAKIEQNKKYAGMLLSFVSYNENKKYDDFKEGQDKIAAFGVMGLVAGSAEPAITPKKGQGPAPAESNFAKFIKIFGLILLGIVVLAGVAGGAYYLFRMLQKRRAAKMAAVTEIATEPEAGKAAPKT